MHQKNPQLHKHLLNLKMRLLHPHIHSYLIFFLSFPSFIHMPLYFSWCLDIRLADVESWNAKAAKHTCWWRWCYCECHWSTKGKRMKREYLWKYNNEVSHSRARKVLVGEGKFLLSQFFFILDTNHDFLRVSKLREKFFSPLSQLSQKFNSTFLVLIEL